MAEKRRFLASTRKFQTKIMEYAGAETVKYWADRDVFDRRGRSEWRSTRQPIPKFVDAPAPVLGPVAQIAADAGILAGLTILFFMLAFFSFLRYDVR